MAHDNVTPVRRAFGIEADIKLDSGRELRLQKWSVSKTIKLGMTVSRIFAEGLSILKRQSQLSFDKACKEAKAEGYEEGDDGWPIESELDILRTSDIVATLPELILKSTEDIAEFIESSLTLKGGVKQLTKEQILGESEDDEKNLDLDEFPDLLRLIIERNLTAKTVKKWKALFASGASLLR